MIRPYYKNNGITIFHGDARKLLIEMPLLEADAIVTDPPYGVGVKYGSAYDNRKHENPEKMDDATYLLWLKRTWVIASKHVAPDGALLWFWPSRRAVEGREVLPRGWMIYHVAAHYRREFAGDLWRNPRPSMCWEPIMWAKRRKDTPRYFGPKGWAGRDCIATRHYRHDKIPGDHPCPKPLEALQFAIQWVVPKGGLVLDPFMGTGTSLRAAKDLGIRAVGIEIEEKHCETAVKRLSQEVLALK